MKFFQMLLLASALVACTKTDGTDGDTDTDTDVIVDTDTTDTDVVVCDDAVAGDTGTDCSACIDCALGEDCADDLDTCSNDADCAQLLGCIQACAGDTDAGCEDTCFGTYPDGATNLQTLFECVNTTCSTSCNG